MRMVCFVSLFLAASGSAATWQVVPTGSMDVPRCFHTATLLPSGKVLIAGGALTFEPTVTSSSELYDPAIGTFTLGADLNVGRTNATATSLPDGKVLIVGGYSMHPPAGETLWLTSVELYDPIAGTFKKLGGLKAGRYNHSATARVVSRPRTHR